jgi:hypothetical protein
MTDSPNTAFDETIKITQLKKEFMTGGRGFVWSPSKGVEWVPPDPGGRIGVLEYWRNGIELKGRL